MGEFLQPLWRMTIDGMAGRDDDDADADVDGDTETGKLLRVFGNL